MLKWSFIILVCAIAVVLVLATFQPGTFRVERSALLKSPPEKILAQINDFHRWADWSPWDKIDPSMKKTYSGPASGKGAVYEWEGTGQVGQGRMEIVETTPSQTTIQLDFLKPMRAHDRTDFTLIRQGGSTQVTWSMEGSVPFIGKIFHLFFNMDKMIGGQYEIGLANLKAICEK